MRLGIGIAHGPFSSGGGGSEPEPVLLGTATPNTVDEHFNPNYFWAKQYTAPASGTVNGLHVLGHKVTASTGQFRLALYRINTVVDFDWSASTLLGVTATTTGIGVSEDKYIAFTAPASVVEGEVVVIGVHSNGDVHCQQVTGGGVSADTFADGTNASLTTYFANPVPCVYGYIE